MTVIYEFCGRPGAGKTHVCRLLLAHLLDATGDTGVMPILSRRRPFVNPLLKLWGAAHGVLFRTGRTLDLLRYRRAVISATGLSRAFSIYLNALYLDDCLSRGMGDYDLVLIDQGFMQLCWSLQTEVGQTIARRFLHDLYAPYASAPLHLVWVQASPSVVAYNLCQRDDLQGTIEPQCRRFDSAGLHRLTGELLSRRELSFVHFRNDAVDRIDIGALLQRLTASGDNRGQMHH
ncbi:hypothetical protein ACFPTY_09005 [Halomonas beimenensis]|uniref:Thymidylate kinase n=1 Tax=Halomonas beimenensis TaxID=475662 RepID=A0A291P899_9GAMM|nr:hypothetical protein [Halomonas beimenensis]ATJ83136.1 hypothetical protein BEI_2149 [Halomonas beimenensis]